MTRQPASPDLFYIERRSVIEMLEDYDVLERAQRSVVAVEEDGQGNKRNGVDTSTVMP